MFSKIKRDLENNSELELNINDYRIYNRIYYRCFIVYRRLRNLFDDIQLTGLRCIWCCYNMVTFEIPMYSGFIEIQMIAFLQMCL